MNPISQFFRRKKNVSNIDQQLYRVEYFNSLAEAQSADVLELLRSEAAHVVYIKDVIDPKIQKRLLEAFRQLRQKKDCSLGKIDMYPKSFVTKMYEKDEPNDFFIQTKNAIQEVNQLLGFDLESQVLDLLTSLNNGNEVGTKSLSFKAGSFSPFQFRTLNKSKKTYNVHCENGQHEWAPTHNVALGLDKLQMNCIPCFITLQAAEGGELVLFDKLWQSGQYTEPINEFYNNIVTKTGRKFDCSPDGIKRMIIDVKERDMILFNGGYIWHMIEQVRSERERITLGSFIEKGHNGKTYVWC